jgi:hypothetical protein
MILLLWTVKVYMIELSGSLHASDDRFLLPDHASIRQRNVERFRQRVRKFFNCYPPTTLGVPGTPTPTDADHPCRKDDFVRESENCLIDGFA